MKFVKRIIEAVKATRRGILWTWGNLCESYFDIVAMDYPVLIENNIKNMGIPTIDLLESGQTNNESIDEPQYPRLSLNPLKDPAIRTLYEVGAIRIHPSGDTIVEPSPVALLRGLARLALPDNILMGIVNAVRQRRGAAPMNKSEFADINRELFNALRRGLHRSIGERWFSALNQSAYYLHRSMALPCTRLPHSQEFYEEGIKFYKGQGNDTNVFIYSTTSGLVIPREFRGDDASKNHYRYNYFTKGILGTSKCTRVYQWERYRTARELALEYERAPTDIQKRKYLDESYETLGRFANARRLSIHEVDHFSTWKTWCTLVGPERQLLSIRDKKQKLKIGYGIEYDASPLKKRADLLSDLAMVIGSIGALGAIVGKEDFIKQYGPAITVAAAITALGCVSTKRLNPFIREPFMKKCTKDRDSSNTYKSVGQKLSHHKVVQIVDGLLNDGINILKSEREADHKREKD